MRALAVVLLLAFLAGCTTPPATPPSPGPEPSAPLPTSILTGTVEPPGFDAPTFKLLGPAATGGPGYSVGEPAIRASMNGTLYVSFPGCDTDSSILVPVDAPNQRSCANGPVYKSSDEGASWKLLNDPVTGKLSSDGPSANNDAELAVDANGTVYASDLGDGLPVYSSKDGGATWGYLGNVVPKNENADRQWMAAAKPGNLIVGWMGSLGKEARSLILNTTFDGGATWTGAVALGKDIGWVGPVQFAPNGIDAYGIFTQPDSTGLSTPVGGSQTCRIIVAHSPDAGRTWSTHDAGVTITTNVQGGHWSCVNMAPALDITGDGHVVAAWSEDIESPMDLTSQGAVVKAVVGQPGAGNWSAPLTISTEPTAIMPWVAGGAGDRFAVTYLSSNVPLDPDYGGTTWDLQAVVVDNGTAAPRLVRATVDKDIHEGGICSQGSGCFTGGSDRFLLDFFQNDLMPDGRLVIVYPANPAQGARFVEIRVAIQDGGTALLQRP